MASGGGNFPGPGMDGIPAEGTYVPKIAESVLATVREELAKKEEKQKKHYFNLSQLQSMARDLPGKYQQRLPYDLLSTLASALLDGTVFEIVNSLKEVQQLEERSLSGQRLRLLNEQKVQRQEMIRKHREAIQDCQSKPHNLPYLQAQCHKELEVFEKKFEEELRRREMKTILELDQKVMDQQSTLEKAGVPGFFVTNNPNEIHLQMYLLEFVVRLQSMDS